MSLGKSSILIASIVSMVTACGSQSGDSASHSISTEKEKPVRQLVDEYKKAELPSSLKAEIDNVPRMRDANPEATLYKRYEVFTRGEGGAEISRKFLQGSLDIAANVGPDGQKISIFWADIGADGGVYFQLGSRVGFNSDLREIGSVNIKNNEITALCSGWWYKTACSIVVSDNSIYLDKLSDNK